MNNHLPFQPNSNDERLDYKAFLRLPRYMNHLWGVLLAWLLLYLGASLATPVRAQSAADDGIRDFALVSSDEGWLLYNNRLYWKHLSDSRWADITPANIGQQGIQEVFFVDSKRGWLILSELGSNGLATYQLARTEDGGSTWGITPLPFLPEADAPDIAALHLQFVDPNTGWLVTKHGTSSNFSIGSLWATLDGGQSWEKRSIPLGEPVYFINEQFGWTAGGVGQGELYRTMSGGMDWEQTQTGAVIGADEFSRYQLPVFESAESGVLPVVISGNAGTRVEFYKTIDGGASWQLAQTTIVGDATEGVPTVYIEIFDTKNWVIIKPNSGQLWRTVDDSQSQVSMGGEPAFAAIVKLDMATTELGWASSSEGNCVEQPGPTPNEIILECSLIVKLLQTIDGGQTWDSIALPDGIEVVEESFAVNTSVVEDETGTPRGLGDRTQVFAGQGFDSCTRPSVSQMQTWYSSSPYRVWNLYIGGSSLASFCGTLNASFVSQLTQQGWAFIPTWVGPQMSCAGGSFGNVMSPDPGTAYNQGVAEANAALDAASNLGLTVSDKSGTIIYYDLESYSQADTACRNATKSFMSGWTAQLRSRNNEVGVYGSPCSSFLSDFATIPNVPDAVWIAAWLTPAQYRPDASVSPAPCIDNTLWNDQQRLRQYAGGHNETWGGVTINIDSNVLSGIVSRGNICPQSGGVFLYIHGDFNCNGQGENTGYVGRATTGWQNIPEPMNDDASSSYIPSGWSVRLFEHGDRNGGNICLNAGQSGTLNFSLLGNFPGTPSPIKDKVSSFEVFSYSCLSHDEFANAKQISSLPFADTVDTAIATSYLDDPAFTQCNRGSGLASVWYRYVASANGKLTVDTLGSSYDTVLGVWTGNRGGLTPVVCNDNASGGSQSLVEAPVLSGTTYYIEVAGVSQNGGTLKVNAKFQAGSGYFTDVPITGKEWMQPWIEKFYNLGITTGCATNPRQYCPEREVTRAEMAVFLLRAMHRAQLPYTPPAASGTFDDLPVTGKEWMEAWVEEFYAKGITSGCANAPLQYCPERAVTRAEMAVFVLRGKHYVEGTPYNPPTVTHAFSDMPVAGKEWMEPWVDQFYNEGITTGCGQDASQTPPRQYCPERNVTRAEMAVFILRAFGIAP